MLNGLEAIQFQSTPIIHKRLSEIFQRAIIYRDSINYSKKRNLSEVEYRRQCMLNYCKDTLQVEFKSFCKDQFNLIVRQMFFNNTSEIELNWFATYVSMDDVESTINQFDIYSGQTDITDKEVNESFMELVNYVDFKTGKIKDNVYAKNLKKPKNIYCSIFFDPITAFLLKDYVNNHLVDDFSAEELASMLLHEIAHTITLIEHSADHYYRINRPIKHIEHILTYKSTDDVLNIAIPKTKEFINDVTQLQNDKNTIYLQKMSEVLGVMDYSLRSVEESRLTTMFTLISQMISVCIVFILKVTLGIYLTILMRGFKDLFNKTSVSGIKSSDTLNGPRNYYHIERLTDEIVSRFGAGAYLASALQKMNKIDDILSIGISSERLNKSKYIAYMLTGYLNSVTMLGHALHPPQSSEYESEIDRIKRLLQNNMQVFKNEMSDEVSRMYIDDTTKLIKILDSYKTKSMTVSKILTKIFNLIPVTSPGEFILKLTTGNITKEIDEMLKEIESIINTKLNFQSARFNQLSQIKSGNENFDYVIQTDTWDALDYYIHNQS